MGLVLASASPRRRRLLEAIGLRFEIVPADLDEEAIAGGLEPAEAATAVARAKAEHVDPGAALVLAADTMVVLDDVVYGKPADAATAHDMLARLRDRAHEVVTAVCLRTPAGVGTAVRHTTVRMRDYGDAEVAAWVASGKAFDKAGAYAIQDDDFQPVETISGCYCNVMGLPLWTVYRRLASAGCVAPLTPDEVLTPCVACPLRALRRG
jgi:septum formation protein